MTDPQSPASDNESPPPAMQPQSAAAPQRSQALVVIAAVCVAVALGSVVVAFAASQRTESTQPASNPSSDTAPPSTAAPDVTTTATSGPPRQAETIAPAAPTTAELDPTSVFQALASDSAATSLTSVAVDDCGDQYAMLANTGAVQLYLWRNDEWQDQTDLLDLGGLNLESATVRSGDVTMDGSYEFLVELSAIDGMRPFGGIFGATGCSWDWIPIRDGNDTYRFIDSLYMGNSGGLTASGFDGSDGRKSVYVIFDEFAGEFVTSAVDQPIVTDAPAAPPAQTRPATPQKTLVSTTCEVRSMGLTSDL